MAIAFSRSLRSLQADRWRATLLGLVVAILLLTAWCGWFFFASIAFSESGRVLAVDDNGFLIAEFPSASLARLKRGQSALVQPGGTEPNKLALPAVIAEVYPDDLPPGQIRLALPPRHAVLDNPLQARVQIILERLTPMQLVLRHIGLTQTSSNGQ